MMEVKTEGKRTRGRHRLRWIDSITGVMNLNLRGLSEG